MNTQWFVPLAGAVAFLAACAQVATVKNMTPAPPSVAAVPGVQPASARDEERNPEAALSRDLDVAARIWAALKQDPDKAPPRQLYNYSVGRVVSLLQATLKLPNAKALTIRTGSGAYHLTFGSDIKLFDNPQQCQFIPADELTLSGRDYRERVRRDGIGAPVLAETDSPVERAREQFLLSDRIYYGMTTVLQFQGSEARLRMTDPLAVRSASIGGHSYPLAADFSVGPAMILAKDRPQRLGFIRLIRPAKYAYTVESRHMILLKTSRLAKRNIPCFRSSFGLSAEGVASNAPPAARHAKFSLPPHVVTPVFERSRSNPFGKLYD